MYKKWVIKSLFDKRLKLEFGGKLLITQKIAII